MKKTLLLILITLCSYNFGHAQSMSDLSAEQLMMLQMQMESQGTDMQKGLESLSTKGVGTSNLSTLYTDDEVTNRRKLNLSSDEDNQNELDRKPDTIPGITLPVFGRNIFYHSELNFAPNINVSTPASYVLTPGDKIVLNIWGAAENEHKLEISPDGYITIPDIGLVYIGGNSITKATNIIKSRLVKRFEGVASGDISVNLSLGDIGTIKINIVGEAYVPGTYTIPSLATMFNALYVAGGVNSIGSLRDIKLYRGGKLISTLDVYDYLINGKVQQDKRLEDNDLIVVSPYKNLVQVAGSVKRPMTYELKDGEKLEKLISYAGGFDGLAFSENLNVVRSATGRQKQIFTVDRHGLPYFVMMDRDSVTITSIDDKFQNRIEIEGAVMQPGYYELSDKIATVKALIATAQGLEPNAFLGRAFVTRLMPDSTYTLIAFNVEDLLTNKIKDIELQKDDKVKIYMKDYFQYKQTVQIIGEVNHPDTISFARNMTLFDAITMAGGLTEAASYAKVDISRRYIDAEATEAPSEISEVFTFKVNGDLNLSEQSKKFELKPFDIVYIRKSPGYTPQIPVVVMGEVNFDGQYILTNTKTTLSEIITQAGGLTSNAYTRGAYLKRKKTMYDLDREKALESIMEAGAVNLYSYETVEETVIDTLGTSLEDKELGTYYTVGIDLYEALQNPGSVHDITLSEDDILVIPIQSNTVRITGAVYYPNTVTYDKSISLKNYIKQAGGYTKEASRNAFIVYQNGMVSTHGKVAPGCEIVVPYKRPTVPMGPQGWISLGTSVVSMAAMIISLVPTT